eukprot:519383-Pelagomonas_calceolata.AAC.8
MQGKQLPPGLQWQHQEKEKVTTVAVEKGSQVAMKIEQKSSSERGTAWEEGDRHASLCANQDNSPCVVDA